MVFIQCSLSGIVFRWFLRLRESYKEDWPVLASAFNKNFLANEIIHVLQIRLEGNEITSKLASQKMNSGANKSNHGIKFTQTMDPVNKNKPIMRLNCNYCHISNPTISNCIQKLREDKERKRHHFLILNACKVHHLELHNTSRTNSPNWTVFLLSCKLLFR